MAKKITLKKPTKKDVKEFAVMNLGCILLAAGVYLFKAPNNFATGGVSGLSIILTKFITPAVPWLDQPVIMTAMNVLLLIIGFIFLGRGCTVKTVYCCLTYSFEMWLMEFIPLTLPLTGEMFLEFILAMLFTGAGSAFVFNAGASSGGTDIIALIIKKYTNLHIGRALLATDFVIASSTFFIFGVTTGLYSVLGLFIKTFLLDSIIESIGKSKYLTIITSNPDAISPYILQTMHRGYTRFEAKGGFTGENKTIMYTVLNRSEAIKLKIQINKTDPTAFVIITDANEILGKGFRSSI